MLFHCVLLSHTPSVTACTMPTVVLSMNGHMSPYLSLFHSTVCHVCYCCKQPNKCYLHILVIPNAMFGLPWFRHQLTHRLSERFITRCFILLTFNHFHRNNITFDATTEITCDYATKLIHLINMQHLNSLFSLFTSLLPSTALLSTQFPVQQFSLYLLSATLFSRLFHKLLPFFSSSSSLYRHIDNYFLSTHQTPFHLLHHKLQRNSQVTLKTFRSHEYQFTQKHNESFNQMHSSLSLSLCICLSVSLFTSCVIWYTCTRVCRRSPWRGRHMKIQLFNC